MSESDVLDQIIRGLKSIFQVRRLIVFGSRARGDYGEDSDYDVLVVADTTLPFVERQGRALIALGKRDFSLDLLVYTPEEYEVQRGILGSAVYCAEREGHAIVA